MVLSFIDASQGKAAFQKNKYMKFNGTVGTWCQYISGIFWYLNKDYECSVPPVYNIENPLLC